jgi:hypothetical protein
MSNLLNRRRVRELALEAAKTRAHRFTRVGTPFYIRCEANVREFIRAQIQRLPSKGRTIL